MIITVAANDPRLHEMWMPLAAVIVPCGPTRIVRPGRATGNAAILAEMQRYFDYDNLVLAVIADGDSACIHDITTTADYDANRQVMDHSERLSLIRNALLEVASSNLYAPSSLQVCKSAAEVMHYMAGTPVGKQMVFKSANNTFGRGSNWLAVNGYCNQSLKDRLTNAD